MISTPGAPKPGRTKGASSTQPPTTADEVSTAATTATTSASHHKSATRDGSYTKEITVPRPDDLLARADHDAEGIAYTGRAAVLLASDSVRMMTGAVLNASAGAVWDWRPRDGMKPRGGTDHADRRLRHRAR